MGRTDVIALFGPTGVGKTEVALALADALRAVGEDPVAVSADALQVYEGLETLTGVATPAEQARLEHRLVSFLPPDAQFTAGAYAELAHREIDELLTAGRRPIVVGGTGLYLRAALAELSLRPPVAPRIRERWIQALETRGPQDLHAELAALSPQTAMRIAPTDAQRIVRALELYEAGELRDEPGESELWTQMTRTSTLLAGLVIERDVLYAQINARVDRMVAAGARDEAVRADLAGAGTTARKALGFRELLDGDVEAMKQRTRAYARRQLTWMRKLPDVWILDMTDRSAQQASEEIVRRWLAV